MLNTGKFWKRDYESDYAIARRFIQSNPSCSSLDLRKALARDTNDPLLSMRSGQAETIFGDCRLRTQLRSIRAVKNCPLCAKQLFHCDVFDAEWLLVCPIHNVPLTKQCPECNYYWPDVISMLETSCSLCGRVRSVNELAEDHAHRKYIEFNDIQLLYQAIHPPIEEVKLRRTARDLTTNQVHSNTGLYNEWYPSFIATLSDSHRQLMKRLQVSLFETATIQGRFYDLVFREERIENEMNPIRQQDTLDTDWVKDIQAAVNLSIVSKWKRELPLTVMSRVSNSEDLLSVDLYRLAYTFWNDFVRRPRQQRRHYVDLLANNYYRAFELDRIPDTPAPMTKVVFVEDTDRQGVVLDHSLQARLYRLDLWALFIQVYAYISCLAKVQKRPVRAGQFVSVLPYLLYPNECYNYPAMMYSKDDRVVLTVPACLYREDLDASLYLYMGDSLYKKPMAGPRH